MADYQNSDKKNLHAQNSSQLKSARSSVLRNISLVCAVVAILVFALVMIDRYSRNTPASTTEKTSAATQKNSSEEKQQTDQKKSSDTKSEQEDSYKSFNPSQNKTDFVSLTMDDGNKIVIKLIPHAAPKTVENFKNLVSKGFYNGLTFHRVIDGFMIQGGDPQGTGTGGSDSTIPGEFKANGFNNTLSHQRGTVSMARAQDYNSASSQFFICNGDAHFLDGEYAAFGVVIRGMDEVDHIARLKKNAQDKPLEPPVIKKVEFVTPQKS